ncbi:hypothetical protein NM688_g2444 [Phlebia brevispora]|uniref:Uncharacterized protein n=1 Tax=Phlebia brevispora TaxID=194682 RepID=A0ACC1T8C1_9APHY|nr:hypothetical protein NM688_g2444 [Phlebia brevispora]
MAPTSGPYSKFQRDCDATENADKVAEHMSRCMHQDARRRFVYGFTAEDSTMRLWYCDRKQIICSESFDLLLRSDDHSSNSPSRSRSRDAKTSSSTRLCSYPTANPHHCNTKSKSARLQATSTLTARWGGCALAIYTSWERLRGYPGAAIVKATSTPGSAGLQLAPNMKQIWSWAFLPSQHNGDVLVGGVADCTRISPASVDEVHGRRRTHYRIVYKDVCEPLRFMSAFYVIFADVEDACYRLYALHQCSWVHHDISLDKILIYNDVVKIADLEHAERTAQLHEQKHIIVGTGLFMALEVNRGRYLSMPEPLLEEVSAFDAENDARLAQDEPMLDRTVLHGVPQFSYNPLHDRKSLLWVTAYTIVCYVIEDTTNSESARRNEA